MLTAVGAAFQTVSYYAFSCVICTEVEEMIRDCPLSALPRRGELPVGVLGMNRSRIFGRWRRQINTVVVA